MLHTVEVTAANEADINVLPKLLRDGDKVILGDAGYTNDEYKRESQQFGFTRTRYRRLMKNAVQVSMLMDLANLYLLYGRIAGNLRRNSLKMPQRQTMKHKQGKSGGKTLPKNELPGIHIQKTDSNTKKSENL